MKIVNDTIALAELTTMAEKMFGSLVKAVVDVERGIMAVDAELHSDEERLLLEDDSKQENLWGINLHPNLHPQEEWIEFDSIINIRPAIGNRSRYVNNAQTRAKIVEIVQRLVTA